MKKNQNNNNNNNKVVKNGGFIPNSLRFISSCIKTISSNVRSTAEYHKDQVLWACFDNLELGPSIVKRVLLLGYSNGFQILDIEDASNVCELVSRRDDPVTFLQMQPSPANSEGREGFRNSHPLLLVVASDEARHSGPLKIGRDGLVADGDIDFQTGSFLNPPTAVRFYSLRSHSYVHVLRFRSTVYMVRCSPLIVAVGLAAQVYCFDALTLENKFSVLTYPVPQLGGQGTVGVNTGYGPMAVGPRWLAYASNNPLSSKTGRLSPQSLSPSLGVSPTSPGSGSLVARYTMESSKQVASGLINLGDMGYKTFSKFYHELLPDGSSSPVLSNSGGKVGRFAAHATEADTAGMVVIKDYVSRAVISQFRAHSSPLSALCFDPSGTLLVTASIHGNNINIFRIMPSCSQNGSGTQSYDWSSSHVHLYKLHRGITSAVIQDICFSHYSQWVAIVSSRGTCHVFVLSPFGGETGLKIQNSLVDGPTLLPVLSLPWWSASSLTVNEPSFSPPPPTTLSVVCRIRISNSGWLNTVSNAVPSGVVAAVFHRSLPCDIKPALSGINSLEHLLVYAPSGDVIQYELLPSMVGEQGDPCLRTGTGSLAQMQEEELKVKGEPVQWWDVCRRTDWPEKAAKTVLYDYMDSDIGQKDLVKPHERSQVYVSHAEVQVRTPRLPIWQKSKIYFFTMTTPDGEEQAAPKDSMCGEFEIEKIIVHEVEIRRKDLLHVFDHFHRVQTDWSDDRLVGGKYSGSFSTSDGKQKFREDSTVSNTMLASPSRHGYYVNNPSSPESSSVSTEGTIVREFRSSDSVVSSEGSNTSSNRSNLSMNIIDEEPVHDDMPDPIDFGQYFREEYCKASSDNCPCNQEKSEEDGDKDDMLGGVFAFYEEG